MDEHPLVRFAEATVVGSPAGRSGNDIWEVIAAVRDNGGNVAETLLTWGFRWV